MTERQKSLAERREELLARSSIQRELLIATMADVWQPGAVLTSKNIMMQARQKPVLAGVMGLLGFLFFRKRRLFSLLAAAAVAMQTWNQFSPYIKPVLNKLPWLRKK